VNEQWITHGSRNACLCFPRAVREHSMREAHMLPERLWKPGGYGHHAVAVLESTYSGLWHPHRIVSTIAVSILTRLPLGRY
jgi:hypothetical protein